MTDIKIYTTNSCPYCDLAKEYLKKKKISYKEINVEKDDSAAKEMVQKSGQMGVPVLEIGKEIIVGFNEAKIDKAIAKNQDV